VVDLGSEAASELLALAQQMAGPVQRLAFLWARAPSSVTPRLSVQQLRALEGVDAAPGVNLTGLADTLDMGVPTASRLCDRLEAAGLLERGISPENRREIHLRTTSRGRDLVDQVAAQRSSDLASLLQGMPPKRRAELLSGLQALPPAPPERTGRGNR
jgi:DNA-binding MarR family transcriptional regulator